MGSRYYNPEIGRFINADAVSCLGLNSDFNSFNLFTYCGNNPVSRKDIGGNGWVAVLGSALVGGFLGAISGASAAIDAGGNVANAAIIGAIGGAIAGASLATNLIGTAIRKTVTYVVVNVATNLSTQYSNYKTSNHSYKTFSEYVKWFSVANTFVSSLAAAGTALKLGKLVKDAFLAPVVKGEKYIKDFIDLTLGSHVSFHQMMFENAINYIYYKTK